MSEEIMTPKIENGTMNLMGMQMKISDIIGDKLVDQFIKMSVKTPSFGYGDISDRSQ